MIAASIVGALLQRHGPLLEVVSQDRIKAGQLPDGVTLPALLVRVVSITDRNPLKHSPMVRSTARVAVTVRATSYREKGLVIRLCRAACAGFVGDIADALRVSVLTAGLGPDLIGQSNTFEQTQDFRVSFDAAD